MLDIDVKQYRKSEYDIDSIFLERWSPRSFSTEEVEEEVLMSVFEAARWAPSANNMQPWRFIIARTKEDRERFYPFIMEGNRLWCEKAPVLVLIVSDKEDASHAFDTGAAWGFMSLQAKKKGLITHAMTGFDKEKAREVLNVPEQFDIQALVAIGYQDKKELLPEQLQEREQPSTREPLSTFLHEGTFQG